MPVLRSSYLLRFAAALAGLLILAWLYILSFPMAFLPGGYAYWAAKADMLKGCELGQLDFYGDSRVEAGVIPALLPVPASNLGVAAGTPLEVSSSVRRALACPNQPRQVVLAVTAEHFAPLSLYFWTGTLRYGFLPLSDLWHAKRLAAALGDTDSFDHQQEPAELPKGVRDWAYALHIPSAFFSSLVRGRLFGRYSENMALYRTALKDRGWFEHTDWAVGREPAYPAFWATPMQAALFEGTIRSLLDRGIQVGLLVMPISPGGRSAGAVEAGYRAYLGSVASRIPGVTLVNDAAPVWPQRLFADDFHMNGAAARLFTARLAACMRDGIVQPGCDLGWHDGVAQSTP